MKDSSILKICFITSIIGLATIYIGTLLTEAKEVEISEINERDIGRLVKVKGKISWKYFSKKGNLFFKLKNKGEEIKVVVFKDLIDRLGIKGEEIKKGKGVSVLGTVEKYKGEIEIIPERIKIK